MKLHWLPKLQRTRVMRRERRREVRFSLTGFNIKCRSPVSVPKQEKENVWRE